jgi:hypothetical protein
VIVGGREANEISGQKSDLRRPFAAVLQHTNAARVLVSVIVSGLKPMPRIKISSGWWGRHGFDGQVFGITRLPCEFRIRSAADFTNVRPWLAPGQGGVALKVFFAAVLRSVST